jgi:hypothetical protein
MVMEREEVTGTRASLLVVMLVPAVKLIEGLAPGDN